MIRLMMCPLDIFNVYYASWTKRLSFKFRICHALRSLRFLQERPENYWTTGRKRSCPWKWSWLFSGNTNKFISEVGRTVVLDRGPFWGSSLGTVGLFRKQHHGRFRVIFSRSTDCPNNLWKGVISIKNVLISLYHQCSIL